MDVTSDRGRSCIGSAIGILLCPAYRVIDPGSWWRVANNPRTLCGVSIGDPCDRYHHHSVGVVLVFHKARFAFDFCVSGIRNIVSFVGNHRATMGAARFTNALDLLGKSTMNDNVELQSLITCPQCGHSEKETMPTDSCQWIYDCKKCGAQLKPKHGDCCVFCSYGTVPCPPIQVGGSCCQ